MAGEKTKINKVIAFLALYFRTVGLNITSCSDEVILKFEEKVKELYDNEGLEYDVKDMPLSPKDATYRYSSMVMVRKAAGQELYIFNIKSLLSAKKTHEELWMEFSGALEKKYPGLIEKATKLEALQVLFGNGYNHESVGKVIIFLSENSAPKEGKVKVRTPKKKK